MLQQTQVVTVIPYYERFMLRFPSVQQLAVAHEDEVLHLWSGLGYYSRGRNLHKAARQIVQQYGGEMPRRAEEWEALPGVGQSTAHAILSLALNSPLAILDANVKRVLARVWCMQNDFSATKEKQALWAHAQNLVPLERAGQYNQALMDLGAMVCTNRNPQCSQCPLQQSCKAFAQGLQAQLPAKVVKKPKPTKHTDFMLLSHGSHCLLKQRPSKGVWANLWVLPTLEEVKDINLGWLEYQRPVELRTTFTHYHLKYRVHYAQVSAFADLGSGWLWFNRTLPVAVGVPAPIAKLIAKEVV